MPATRAAWEKVFATVLGGLPVLRVIVTHMHPDHIGCAHWLCERWNVRLWISATDFNVARLASSASAGFGGPLSASLHGAARPGRGSRRRPQGRCPHQLLPEPGAGAACQLPAAVRRRQRRHRQRRPAQPWTCHAGFGHAPEHMALHDATHGVLISGDMVLPRISTNVSVIDVEPEADSLTLYLESIERMRSIPADTLVLPSHGRPFKGLHTRIDQLQQHHDARFVDVLEALAVKGPQSAFELVPVIFRRPLDLHQMTFAMGESIAHMHALWFRGKLDRRLGDDGVYRFALAA
jgi:glyoxylase-like metal-dependent hydrolase (beta-lactamase superfamily II)